MARALALNADAPPLPVEAAVAHAATGGLLAYPTETLWGLGADARSTRAVEALRAWKGRDAARPLSLLVSGAGELVELGAVGGERLERAVAAFWPGPLTLVVRCAGRLAPGVARADGAVGFRCSPHPVAAALARACARAGVGPLTATSLNASGAPPARTREEAAERCAAARGPRLVAGPDAGGGAATSVVDLSGARPVLLRAGAVTREALAEALGEEIAP